ncbi:hypothetical protein MHYP_G00142580 [Metynnis hypsauchen]
MRDLSVVLPLCLLSRPSEPPDSFSPLPPARRAGGQDGEHQEWKKREATQDLYALLFPYLFYFRRKKTERGGKKEMSVKPRSEQTGQNHKGNYALLQPRREASLFVFAQLPPSCFSHIVDLQTWTYASTLLSVSAIRIQAWKGNSTIFHLAVENLTIKGSQDLNSRFCLRRTPKARKLPPCRELLRQTELEFTTWAELSSAKCTDGPTDGAMAPNLPQCSAPPWAQWKGRKKNDVVGILEARVTEY